MLDGAGNGWWAVMCRCQKQAITLILFALFSPDFVLCCSGEQGSAGNDSKWSSCCDATLIVYWHSISRRFMSSSWVSHFITHTKYSHHFVFFVCFFLSLWRPLKQRERSHSTLWNVTWAWRESSNLQPGNVHSHVPKIEFIFMNMNIYDWKRDSLRQI